MNVQGVKILTGGLNNITPLRMRYGMKKWAEVLLNDTTVIKLDIIPFGWKVLRYAMTAPRGWFWAYNGVSQLKNGHKKALVRVG
jgi:hypothetical protein